MRSMALDVGDKRIGVAMSDPLGIIVTPSTVIQRQSLAKDLAEILRVASENDVERIIVGNPISMDGIEREQAQRVQRFSALLGEQTPIPITLWDERLSTVEAKRRLRESGSSARKRAAMVDSVAAAVLLQSYLDSLGLPPLEY